MSNHNGDKYRHDGLVRTQPALNPQTLANNVMEMAKQLNDGQCKDDMTALAVRVFKKTA